MKRRPFFSIILTLVIMLAGCGSRSIKLGWRESNSRARKTTRYETFNDVEQATICVKAQQKIHLIYDVEVNEGTLSLALLSPDGTMLWEATFEADAADAITVEASETDTYTLRVEGRETRGGFDVSWTC